MEKQVWFRAQHFEKDDNQLERVQGRGARVIEGLENMTCEERLKAVRLFSLERGKLKGCMISLKMFKR